MGRKKTGGGFRSVGFRMPPEHYQVLADVAEAKGIDFSAVLNGLIADAVPGLRSWLAWHRGEPVEDDEARFHRVMAEFEEVFKRHEEFMRQFKERGGDEQEPKKKGKR